jgi:hypothetical protein
MTNHIRDLLLEVFVGAMETSPASKAINADISTGSMRFVTYIGWHEGVVGIDFSD